MHNRAPNVVLLYFIAHYMPFIRVSYKIAWMNDDRFKSN